MIDEVNQRLKVWVGEVAGDMPVTFAALDRSLRPHGVSLYLLEISGVCASRSSPTLCRTRCCWAALWARATCPIPGALVELPTLKLSTRTERIGRMKELLRGGG